LHRFFRTGYPAKVSDSVPPIRSGWALTYEQEMLNPRIGFLIECANNVSNYYVDGIQSKCVG
jgi:hypothetical protein